MAIRLETMMEATEIRKDLAQQQGLPRPALAAATERRAEMTPIFLRELDEYLDAPDLDPARTMRLFFIFHLFGEWREKAAYRPLARLLRLPCEQLKAVLGDATTETSHRVMAAVFDGDPQPLFDIIFEEDADEFVRSRMFDAIVMLVLRGEIERSIAEQFLRDGLTQVRPQKANYVWEGWLDAVAMLGLVHFRDMVAEAFERGSFDEYGTVISDFEEMLQRALASPSEPWGSRSDEYSPFGNTPEELAHWTRFREKRASAARQAPRSLEVLHRSLSEGSRINPLRDVGRNDPCPCGSGKKYKKCCLQAGP
jgi:hypothetical protein